MTIKRNKNGVSSTLSTNIVYGSRSRQVEGVGDYELSDPLLKFNRNKANKRQWMINKAASSNPVSLHSQREIEKNNNSHRYLSTNGNNS